MQAITIHQPWASLVAYGAKTIEYRTWQTAYRGPLLICAGAGVVTDGDLVFPHGVAVAVAQVAGCEPFQPHHLEAACMEEMPAAGFAWRLVGAREIVPFRVRGQFRLFSVANTPELIDDMSDDDHIDLFMQQFGGDAGQR